METASDRKVARERKLSLSSWVELYNYISSQVFVDDYNAISEDLFKNPLIGTTLFRDKTLVLTWEHSNDLPSVFIIYDSDSPSERQICLVDTQIQSCVEIKLIYWKPLHHVVNI